MEMVKHLGVFIKEIERKNQKSLESDEIRKIYNSTIRYALGISGKEVFKELADYLNAPQEVKTFRDQLDGSSYILTSYWRAYFSVYRPQCRFCRVNCGKATQDGCEGYRPNLKAISTHYKVIENDLWLAKDYLTPAEKKKSRVMAMAEAYLEKPDETFLDQYFSSKEFNTYCQKLAKTKLYFIQKYDPSIETQDLVDELKVAGIHAARKMEGITDRLHAKNLIKKCVKNFMMNYILKFTCQKNARVVKKEDIRTDMQRVWHTEHGRYEWAFVDINGKVIEWSSTVKKGVDYEMTVLSLDNENENNEKFSDTLQESDKWFEKMHLDNFLSDFKMEVKSNFQQYIDVMMGKPHKKFDEWMDEQKYERASLELDRLGFYARRFFGVTDKQLASSLKILTKLGFTIESLLRA